MVLSLAMIWLMALPVSAQAAVTLKTLKADKTVKSYDFTGNGKKDKIRIKFTNNYMTQGSYDYTVYLNGKKMFTTGSPRGCMFYYCRMNNVPFLIEADHFAGGANTYSVYRYSGKKLKCINADMEKGVGFYLNSTLKKSGNKLYIESSPKFFSEYENPFVGMDLDKMKARTTFVYKSGKIQLSSRMAKIVGTLSFRANREFATSRTPTAPENKNGVYITYQDTITVDRVYFSNDNNWTVYFRVNRDGETGWFPVDQYSKGLLGFIG